MKLGIAQINPKVGDIEGNTKKIIEYIQEGRQKGLDVVIFPEQSIVGYPVQDLIFVSGFVEKNLKALKKIMVECTDIIAVVGFIDKDGKDKFYNAAAILEGGKIQNIVYKQLLPTYDVFDEARYFSEGDESDLYIVLDKIEAGIIVCEDLWDERYNKKVVSRLAEKGAKLILSVNASPYYKGKQDIRENLALNKVTEFKIPIIYVNMIGGQDEITFDGYSFAMNVDGTIAFRAPPFIEGLFPIELNDDASIKQADVASKLPIEEEIFKALSLNLRDYFKKIGAFNKILLGLSGGIDSAFTATVAADAVGADKVVCIYLPTRFNSDESYQYSKKLCDNLGCELIVFPINEIFEKFEEEINKKIKDNEFSVADENLQARIRSNILMYYSNKFGYLLVSTGNKSEISTGYCTLYGDTSGGKNIPGDLFKMELFKICKNYINKEREVIPKFIIDRPPTAELRENQKDEDSLPPYSVLDKILEPLIEEQKSIEDVVAMGFDEALVRKIQRLVKIAEFKRAQLVQTIKITKKSFGIGRRIPIINGFDSSHNFNDG